MKGGDLVCEADGRKYPSEDLRGGKDCVGARSKGECDGRNEKRDEQIRDEQPQNFVGDELKQDTVGRQESPWRQLEELEVARQSSHFPVELPFNLFGPCVVDASARIKHRAVSLPDD